MRITKFVHSCLLVETDDKAILIDPGNYSRQSRMIHLKKLPKLDYIVITHDHPDHYDEDFLRQIAGFYPHAILITNTELAEKLGGLGLNNPVSTGSEDGISVFVTPHEALPLGLPAPANIGVHIGEEFTHPGDSLQMQHVRNTLALPITAPWVSMKQSLERVVELKPRNVIPVHDWYWHKQAREEMYSKTKQWLLPHGIKFIELDSASPIEL